MFKPKMRKLTDSDDKYNFCCHSYKPLIIKYGDTMHEAYQRWKNEYGKIAVAKRK